jgi:hypothetical protein
MYMKKFAFLVLLLLAYPVQAQIPVQDDNTIKAQIVAMQATQNDMLAKLSRVKADIANLQASIDTLGQKIDAMNKPAAADVAQVKQVWQPAVIGSWGQTVQPGRFVSVSTDASAPSTTSVMTTTGSSSMMMSSSSGACANGSCSAGAGRMGLFRRR